jgi:RNA-directed DNA polymerase
MLGIPAVVDRVIQQAVAQVLVPVFDPHFSDRSYGFRPGRSAHQAVRQLRQYVKAGFGIAVSLDLYRYFDEVNHDVLMARVARRVGDKTLLELIGRILRAGVMEEGGQIRPTLKGVPQGGPLSPLLANIVLDDLDKELDRRGHRYCRYADDGVILVRSRRAGERVRRSVTRYLRRRLKLKVNERKSRVAPMGQCGFLGFTVQRGKIRWTDKAEAKFKRRIRALTGRSWGVSLARRLAELAEYERGWMNYFRLSERYRPLPELDGWVRRRVRMCCWKQWRRARTRIRNLVSLGTARRTAIQTAMSRKGYWRLSKTLATQTGLTNGWLAKKGLPSLKEMWVEFHYPARSAG